MGGRHSYWKDYTESELQQILASSENRKDFMMRLGYSRYRAETLKAIQKHFPKLDFSKFTSGVFQNLIGQRFGRLLVLSQDKTKNDKNVWWKCKCDCGNIKSIRAYALKDKSHPVQSCGCLLDESRYEKIVDLSRQKFGHLTVIRRDTEHPDKKRVRYICECDCKNHTCISVLADNLKRGHTYSCGCTRSLGEEKVKNFLGKYKVNYKQEYSFPDLLSEKGYPLRFDFVIFDNNNLPIIAIECQGIQHYQKVEIFGGIEQFYRQQQKDFLKKQYCEKHNIKIIEIPYTIYNKLTNEYLYQYILK